MNRSKPLLLSQAERRALVGWLSDDAVPERQKTRARIVLMSADGSSAAAIAEQLRVAQLTIYRWRQRYRTEGLAGMRDRPRPGKPRTLSDDGRAELVRLTTQCIPTDSIRWSVRSLARYAGVSEWQVREAWRGAGLAPHKLGGPSDVADAPSGRVSELIGLYIAPPCNVACFSVYEPAREQGRSTPDDPSSRRVGPLRRSPTSVYRAFDVAQVTCQHGVEQVSRYRTGVEFLRELRRRSLIATNTHVLVDNNGVPEVTHIVNYVSTQPGSSVHLTPMSAAWLSVVERYLSQVDDDPPAWSGGVATRPWRDEILRYVHIGSEHARRPFVWIKTSNAVFVCAAQARSYPEAGANTRGGLCESLSRIVGPGGPVRDPGADSSP